MYKTILVLVLALLVLPSLANPGSPRKTYKDGTPCKCDSISWTDAFEDIKEMETPYVNGKVSGDIRVYGWTGGTLDEVIPMVAGRKHGMAFAYFADGALSEATPFVADKRHGLAKRFYEGGSLRSETPWVNGKEDGKATYYYKNGGGVAGTTVYQQGRHMGTTCSDGRTGGPALDCTSRK